MAGVARVGVDTINSVPPALIQGTLQTSVKIAGVNVAVVGDAIAPHVPGGVHNVSTISSGNSNVKLAGIAIAINGSTTTCGHSVNSGSGTVNA